MAENITEKGRRQLNYELLRIIAMIMIVCLHYLSKGGILGNPAQSNMTSVGYTAWLIEAFCLVSVNVYVLITGYFSLGDSSIKRPFKIWKQVLFYSIVIGIIAMLAGIQSFDIYRVFEYVFPIVTEHYWFATVYIFLGLLMPFLNAGISRLNKKQMRYIIGIMLMLFSVSKTVIPMHLPWDKLGYDVLWFVALYLTGACIRKYGADFIGKKGVSIATYVMSTLVIYLSFVVIRLIYIKTGKLEDFIDYGYSYNYLFCYTGAVGLFVVFSKIKSEVLEKFRKPIELFASASFGVYLIHEHINVRYLWPTWFNTESVLNKSVPVFILSMLGTVAVVYLSCSAIEILRSKVSAYIKQIVKR